MVGLESKRKKHNGEIFVVILIERNYYYSLYKVLLVCMRVYIDMEIKE